MASLNLAKLTLHELAKALFQFFGLTADEPVGFDVNGKLKNVSNVGATVTEAELVLADNTTADASTDKHGFLPKLSGTDSEFLNGDGNFAAVTKSNVGLENVDNTADADKPVSTATQTALDLKHNLITPATHIADPTGAATDQDDEARAAIVSILNALEAAGIVAGA